MKRGTAVNRALRRKQAGKKNNSGGEFSKQIFTPETTGLSHYQLSKLQQCMMQARQAYTNKDFAQAEKYCNECLSIYPLYAMPLAMLSKIAARFEKYEAAEELILKSLRILPKVPERLLAYAGILKNLGRHDEALSVIDKSLKIEPNSSTGLNRRAGALNVLGRQAETLQIYEKIMKTDPLFGGAHHNFAMQHKFSDGDEYNKYFDKLAVNINKMTKSNDLMTGHFALGKYYEDLKEFKTGFGHFLSANKIVAKDVVYSIEEEIKGVLSNRITFPKGGHWFQKTETGNQSDVPVFIVGMPRSGTTLTEQVLASHPDIHGAGELSSLTKAIQSMPLKQNEMMEMLSGDVDGSEKIDLIFGKAGKWLADDIIALAPDSRHIVDKMPQNFLNLGYKHLLMPNAKVIHCKRNPIDICLSMFRLKFTDKLHFSTDLESLGKYYVAYSQLMDHWKDVFGDKILEVQYEDTVDDLETQARRIIDFVGVEWDDACLDFHKTKRSVNTASVNQVRQPIYKTSVGRHERYGDLLKPLLDALEPVLSK